MEDGYILRCTQTDGFLHQEWQTSVNHLNFDGATTDRRCTQKHRTHSVPRDRIHIGETCFDSELVRKEGCTILINVDTYCNFYAEHPARRGSFASHSAAPNNAYR